MHIWDTLMLPLALALPLSALPAVIGITFSEPHTAHLLILCNTFAVRRDRGELFLYNIAATLPDHKIPQEGIESDSPSNSSLLNL